MMVKMGQFLRLFGFIAAAFALVNKNWTQKPKN